MTFKNKRKLYVKLNLKDKAGSERLSAAKEGVRSCLSSKFNTVSKERLPVFMVAQSFLLEYNRLVSPASYSPDAGLGDLLKIADVDFPEYYGQQSYAKARFLYSVGTEDVRTVGERLLLKEPNNFDIRLGLGYQITRYEKASSGRLRARSMVSSLSSSKQATFIQRYKAILVDTFSIHNDDKDVKVQRQRVAGDIAQYLSDYPEGWLSSMVKNIRQGWRDRGDIS